MLAVSQWVNSEQVMGEEHTTFELKEPASPEFMLPRDYSTAGWIGAALAVLVLLGAWHLWRTRRQRPSHPQALRNLAFKEAVKALDQINTPHARKAAVQASLILRKYLSRAANDPALFETHEEFISRHDALHTLTEAGRAGCAAGFAQLAALKYAPQDPDLAPPAVVSAARVLLDNLHRGFHG
ncbi:MAG: hypothetical protein WCO57_07065 [Verrucomicrobiota bacterium]